MHPLSLYLTLLDDTLTEKGRSVFAQSEFKIIDIDLNAHKLRAELNFRGMTYLAGVGFNQDSLSFSCDCTNARLAPCEHVAALLFYLLELETEKKADVVDTLEKLLDDFKPGQSGSRVMGKAGGKTRTFFEIYDSKPQMMFDLALQPQPLAKIHASYAAALNYQTLAQMRPMAARLGLKKTTGLHRDDLAKALVGALAQSESVRARLEKLSDADRQFLVRLCLLSLSETQVNLGEISKKMPEFKKGRAAMLNPLLEADLVFPYTSDNLLIVPLGLLPVLVEKMDLFPAFEVTREQVQLARPDGLARICLNAAAAASAGLLEFNHPGTMDSFSGVPHLKDGRQNAEISAWSHMFTDDTCRLLDPQSKLPGAILDVLGRVMLAAGFLTPRTGRPAAEFFHWLQLDPARQQKALFVAAASHANIAELENLARPRKIRVVESYYLMNCPQILNWVKQLRSQVFNFLSLARQDRWMSFDVFLKYAFTTTPDSSALFTFEKGGEKLPVREFPAWKQTVGVVIQNIICELAHGLGMVDLAWVNHNELAAFRLTSLGAYMLDLIPQPDLPAEGDGGIEMLSGRQLRLKIQDAGPAALRLAMLAGELKKTDKNGWVYELTAEGLARAFESGLTGAQVRAVLGSQIPEDTAEWLNQCYERRDRLNIYPRIALIQLQDNYALPELMAGTLLGGKILYRISPTLVAVRPEDVEAILVDLQRKGYTPRVKGETK